MQDVTLWQAFESLVTSKDFLYTLAYFAIGIGCAGIFMFVMIICEEVEDAQELILFGLMIIAGWPIFLVIGVFFGIPRLMFVIICDAIRSYRNYKWRKHRRSLR